MSSSYEISVVIPSSTANAYELRRVLEAVFRQDLPPKEVLVICSSVSAEQVCKSIKLPDISPAISVQWVLECGALPGRARNIGVALAAGSFVAFLDISTIPEPNWLRNKLELLEGPSHNDGIIGRCKFLGNSFFSWVVIDAFFGRGPVSTFPGSVFKLEAFKKVGPMLERIRAGEDNEWFQRASMMNVNFRDAGYSHDCNYYGLQNISYFLFCKKWFRNYIESGKLPQYKLIFQFNLFVWIFFLLALAFNWNSMFAGWDTLHPLYVPHVSKMVFIALLLSYLSLRILYLPVRRGTPLLHILSYRFIPIAVVLISADLIKSVLFFYQFLWSAVTPLRRFSSYN